MTSQTIEQWLRDFADLALSGKITFHNEPSMQMKLACFLRCKISSDPAYSDYAVDVEVDIDKAVNVAPKTYSFTKKRIDLVIFKGKTLDDIGESKNKFAIELKFPTNGQFPETMYHFIQDIAFMEEAKGIATTCNGKWFNDTFCFTFANDPNFYQSTGRKTSKTIYNYFRYSPNAKITGVITNPIAGKNPSMLNVIGNYTIQWQPTSINQGTKYYLITI